MRSDADLALIAAIADDLPAGVWVAAAPSGAFVYANRAFEEIMGMGALSDVAVGEYAAPYGIFTRGGEPYPEDQMPFVRALRARAVVIVDDIAIHRRDGSRVFVRAHAKPLFDAAGEVTHVAIAFFDITREVEAQREAAGVQEQLRRVIAEAPIVVSAFGTDGVITLAQGRALTELGRSAESYIGESMLASYSPEIASYARRAIGGEQVTYSLEFRGRSYESRLEPQRDESGAIVGVIGVAVDVTDRRRAEAKLAQAERLASLGMLAAGVAHEVNNPLTYVLGNLDALEEALDSGDVDIGSLRALVHDAREGADRVRAIVRDLKTFSRVGEPRPTRLDIRVPLEAAIAMARNEVRHRARLTVDIAPVPPVHADEGRLAQLFLNLLLNAAQAIEPGAADANEIAVVVRADGDRVVIEVRDTGCGIAPELLPHIFDPFFTTKANGGGTGLGLSVCHAIATGLGGTITAESAGGRGSVLRVSIPAAAGDGSGDRARAPRAAAPGKSGRVLVVDDEERIGRLMKILLAGHDIVHELRARDAVERVRGGERFDVILCDLMMPDMTGMQVYRELRAIAPEQARAVVFMTGGAFTDDARDFLAQVSNEVVEKPFDRRALERLVRSRVG